MTDANTRLAIGIVQLAAVLIIIAALKAAQDLFVPFLLAIFTATLAASPMFWIKRQGAPSWLAICLVILAIILMILFFGGIVAQSATSFMGKLPFYQSQLLIMQANLIDSLDPFISYFDLDLDLASAFGNFSPATLMNLAGTTISSLGSVLSNSFLIILTVIFILAEATSFPDKLNAILTNPERGRVYFSDFTRNLNNYIAIKTTMSVITGIVVTLFLSLLGVDFPMLWGLLAFLLNFVPNIGSVIAAIPPVLLAYVQLGGWSATFVIFGFLIINLVIGSFVEPRYLGKGLGLSPLVVFISLVFWGWVLGPIGMLLSVPLTITAKLALEANPNTNWIAILLGTTQNDDSKSKESDT